MSGCGSVVLCFVRVSCTLTGILHLTWCVSNQHWSMRVHLALCSHFLYSPFPLPLISFPFLSSPSTFSPSLPLHSSPFFFFPHLSLHHNCVTCTCNHLHFTSLYSTVLNPTYMHFTALHRLSQEIGEEDDEDEVDNRRRGQGRK